jgi:cytochrome c-type biogenesis protein CcmH
MNRSRLLLFLCLLFSGLVYGAIEEYGFDSADEEARFKKLTAELRCPKCLNTSIAGSDAPIAADLRREVYRQVHEGRSNEEIIEFMSSRYGDFVLYRPRLTAGTIILWFGPAFLLILGFVIVRRMMVASQESNTEEALSPEEQEALRQILERKTD